MDSAEEFSLKGTECIELKNLLKATGLCPSGGAAKAMVEQGLVTVDGVTETRKAAKIRAGQVVVYNGQSIKVIV